MSEYVSRWEWRDDEDICATVFTQFHASLPRQCLLYWFFALFLHSSSQNGRMKCLLQCQSISQLVNWQYWARTWNSPLSFCTRNHEAFWSRLAIKTVKATTDRLLLDVDTSFTRAAAHKNMCTIWDEGTVCKTHTQESRFMSAIRSDLMPLKSSVKQNCALTQSNITVRIAKCSRFEIF